MNRPLSPDAIADFRDRIIAVATRLFAEEGPSNVTLRRLAAEIGASRTTPYTYFRDKAEIIDCIRIRALDRLCDRYRAVVARPAPIHERLGGIAHAYVAFALAEPNAYRILFDMRDGVDSDNAELRAAVERLTELSRSVWRDAVDAGIARGPAEEANAASWAALHGFVSLHLSGRLPAGRPIEDALPAFLGLLWAGLKNEG